MYYDFRQTGTQTFQPADVWLAVSRDGATWRETRLAGNFDLLDAPNANGLFVGDYHGLAGDGSTFVALYARTNTGDANNRTDVFADRINGDAIATSGAVTNDAARKTAVVAWTASAENRVASHVSAIQEARGARWRRPIEGQAEQKPR
jgi:hypothetical protein